MKLRRKKNKKTKQETKLDPMPLTLTAKKITEVSGAESCCESLTSNTKPSPKPLVEDKLTKNSPPQPRSERKTS